MIASCAVQNTGFWFKRSSTARSMVLAVIVGLHAGVLLYAALFRTTDITPPKVETVLMTRLIAEPAPTRPIMPPVQTAPPVSRRETKPTPVPRVVKTAPPVLKPVIKVPVEPPIAVAKSTPAAPSTPEAAPPPPLAVAAPALPSPPAPAPPAPAPVAAITPPRFNAAYLNNPPPAYPPMARRMGEEGKVMLRVLVTPEGTAGEVRIQTSSGSSVFDDAALDAVRHWRFVPARQGDNSVAAWVQVPVVFKLG